VHEQLNSALVGLSEEKALEIKMIIDRIRIDMQATLKAPEREADSSGASPSSTNESIMHESILANVPNVNGAEKGEK